MTCLCRCGESPSPGKSFVRGHDGTLTAELLNAMAATNNCAI